MTQIIIIIQIYRKIYIYIIREFHNGNEKKEEKIERDIALSKILSRKFIDPLSGIKKKRGERYDLRSR